MKLEVRYGLRPETRALREFAILNTSIEHDNTGHVELKSLQPDTEYFYALFNGGYQVSKLATFKSLPDTETNKTKLNPDGLFNFSFEFGSCNNQAPENGNGPSTPFYRTMNEQWKDRVHFAIQNGDWIYEENREYSNAQWLNQTRETSLPELLRLAPNLAGVWENYKTYITRSPSLREWHRNVPTFFTFDDHELVNDIIGTGTIGYRSRRAAFRDIGIQGWYDYAGWANHTVTKQGIHFGEAQFEKDSDIIYDPGANFKSINYDEASNLIVHWSTKDAGNMDGYQGDFEGGDPNSKVYEIVKVIDEHRVQIRPKAVATKKSKYAIGRYSYSTFKVSNCRFILLDTKSHRDVHDITKPDKKNISMLGKKQKDWLMNLMSKKDADFYFVVSSVNFMIPHVGGGGGSNYFAPTKDDAWTVFFEEREQLINFWDQLGKKVIVLSGDLHNSFVVKITDSVWEFAAGPHNSNNHRPEDQGNLPVNGPFKYGPRECDIKWSTTAMGDIPRSARRFPHFSVIQVNNVFNNPLELNGKRSIPYPIPHIVFQFYDAFTGHLKYAESVHAEK
jgi:phosphodiesterase/alkaline phosphatase D-like protein